MLVGILAYLGIGALFALLVDGLTIWNHRKCKCGFPHELPPKLYRTAILLWPFTFLIMPKVIRDRTRKR